MKRAILAFILIGAYPLTAMDISPKKQTLESKNHPAIHIQLDPEWLEKKIQPRNLPIPHQVTLLDYYNPITDELVASLNPEWMPLKETLSPQQKCELLDAVLHYPVRHNYSIERTLTSIAVCIGTDPNPDGENNMECYIGGSLFLVSSRGMSALDESVIFNDYHAAKYLLEKGANPNIPNIKLECTLHHANSIETAELLLEYGATVPHDLITRCARRRYPVKLMQFYLQKGVEANPNKRKESPAELALTAALNEFDLKNGIQLNPDVGRQTPLHELMEHEETKNQIKKAHLLLNAGIDSAQRGPKGATAFHCAAQYRRPKLCRLLVTQYAQAHHDFLEFLWLLKQNFPHFYKHKDAKRLCYLNLSPIRKLRSVLEMKNYEGVTAFEIWRVDDLNSETCSYEKYLKGSE